MYLYMLLYWIGEYIIENPVTSLVVAFAPSLLTVLFGLIFKMVGHNSAEWIKRVGIMLQVLFLFVLPLSWIYHRNHFAFPEDLVGQPYSAVEKVLLDASDNKCRLNIAEGYASSESSYVFEIVRADSEEALLDGELVENSVSILLYMTNDQEKVDEYKEGSLSLEDMKSDVVELEEISATSVTKSYFVGEIIENSDINVVAYYSDGSERVLEVYEFEILEDTSLSKVGKISFTVSFTDGEITKTCVLNIEVQETELVEIDAEYTGIMPMDGETLAPDDFTVTAYFSDGTTYRVGSDEFKISPETVTEGANTITVSYGGKEASCKITACGKDELRAIDEIEPNDTYSSATGVLAPCKIEGEISSITDTDAFEIALSESGCLSISVESELEYTSIYVYLKSSSDPVWCTEGNQYDSTVQIWKNTFTLDLSKGTYIIVVTGKKNSNSESTTGEYNLTVQFESAECTKSGGHTSLDTAMDVSCNSEIKDQISLTEKNRFYRLEITECSEITLTLTSYMNYISWWLYPEQETDSFYSVTNTQKVESLEKVINIYSIYLKPGIYYLRISGKENDTSSANTGNYSALLSLKVCEESQTNELSKSTLTGIVASNENSRQIELNISTSGKINVNFTTSGSARVEILTLTGNCVWYQNVDGGDYCFENISLDAGSYYVVIYKKNSGGLFYEISYKFIE